MQEPLEKKLIPRILLRRVHLLLCGPVAVLFAIIVWYFNYTTPTIVPDLSHAGTMTAAFGVMEGENFECAVVDPVKSTEIPVKPSFTAYGFCVKSIHLLPFGSRFQRVYIGSNKTGGIEILYNKALGDW